MFSTINYSFFSFIFIHFIPSHQQQYVNLFFVNQKERNDQYEEPNGIRDGNVALFGRSRINDYIYVALVNPYVISSGNCGLPIFFTWVRRWHCTMQVVDWPAGDSDSALESFLCGVSLISNFILFFSCKSMSSLKEAWQAIHVTVVHLKV